ncbi:MAG TPA: hypothetical protein EYP59_21270 [Thiotrichaceae bacterium]|nr:hypothetical protein [Thiotrichaceae bacterium]
MLKVIRPNQEATRYEYDEADNQTARFSPMTAHRQLILMMFWGDN